MIPIMPIKAHIITMVLYNSLRASDAAVEDQIK
jgi:hypothetical protein